MALSLFNLQWYLDHNPDVAAAVSQGLIGAFDHFEQFGNAEGRSAGPLFNAQEYLANNPDVASAVARGETTAYDHFIAFGAGEGRSPISLFDQEFYLSQNPDVAAAVQAGTMSAVEHFLLFGQSEPRTFNPAINLGDYLAANPDVAAAVESGFMTAMEHLMLYGTGESRDLGNGISLSAFSEDPSYQQALASGDIGAALNRVSEVAPFLPEFEPPANWTPPANTPIPTDFVPVAGTTLIIPEGVEIPEGMELPGTFEPVPIAPIAPIVPGDAGGGGGGGTPAITYSATTFTEAAANDGSTTTEITLMLAGDTYAADLTGLIAATNVPAGLTANFVRTSDTVVTATLTGNATNHNNTNDVPNLTFTFQNGAFTNTTTAANVTNYAKSNLVVDFADPDTTAPMIAAGSFTEAGNDTVTLTFNEDMAVTDSAGVIVEKNGVGGDIATGISATGVAINITSTTTLAGTDYVKVSYGSIAGNIVDLAGNKAESMFFYIGGSGINTINASAESSGVRIEGNGGADILTGSNFADQIQGGPGTDDMTGGGGADVFVFGPGETGTPSDSIFDIIRDWNAGGTPDGIVAPGLAIVVNGSASSGVAAINANGFATFDGTDTTLADHITAVEAGIDAGGTAATGQFAVFESGSDSYVFISDGTDGVGAGDVLVQLVNITGLGTSAITGGVLSLT